MARRWGLNCKSRLDELEPVRKGTLKLGPETYTYPAKRYTFTYTLMRRVRVRVRVRVRGGVDQPDHCSEIEIEIGIAIEIEIDPCPGWNLALKERSNFAAERGRHRNSGTRFLISESHHASNDTGQVMSQRDVSSPLGALGVLAVEFPCLYA